MKSVSLLVCSVLFCCRVFSQPNCQRAWRWQACCWHECRLIHPHACLFVSRTPLPIHLVIPTWHGDNLWNIKLDRIWFADSCGSEKKVMSTTGSHKSRKKIKPPGRRENTESTSLCCEAETAEREEQGGERFFLFFFFKSACFVLTFVFQTVKRKPFEHFFVRLSSTWGIYSHLLAEFTADAHISPENTDWLFSTWDTASVKHCTQLLFDSQPGILARRQKHTPLQQKPK